MPIWQFRTLWFTMQVLVSSVRTPLDGWCTMPKSWFSKKDDAPGCNPLPLHILDHRDLTLHLFGAHRHLQAQVFLDLLSLQDSTSARSLHNISGLMESFNVHKNLEIFQAH